MLRTIIASVLLSTAAMTMANAASLDPQKAAVIDRYVASEMQRQRIPGLALGVYVNGSIVLAKGYGLANIELNVPITPDSVMQSGSVGKMFTATAIMMLVEQGRVGLNDSISRYFPEGPYSWRRIKVANLLSHTSGLAAFDTEDLQKPGGPFDIRADFTEDELVEGITELPIEFRPGTRYKYQNTNYVLLGILIHRVTGQFYGDFLKQRIFEPIGMRSSRVISDIDIVPNRSAGYEIVKGKLQNQAWVSPTFNSTADGALYFTINDLEHWDRALYGESLLKARSLQKMWTPFPVGGVPSADGYGFGWGIDHVNGHRVVEHDGAWQGFSTWLSRYLDDKLTVIVLTNLDADNTSPEVIGRGIAGIVNPDLATAPQAAAAPEKSE